MASPTKKTNGSTTEQALAPLPTESYLALQVEAQELRSMIDEYLDDGLQEDDLEQIKIPTGGGLQWELPGASGENMASTFDGVIVGIQTTRSYWPESFSGAGVPPDCTSRDGKTGIGRPGGECEVCPQNQWGSGRNGVGMGCSERKRVYILRPEGFLPVILSLPVTSIKNLRKYQLRLLSQRLPVHAVVTQFSLERTKNKAGIAYSQVQCVSLGPLPEAIAPLAKAYAKTIQTALGMQSEPGHLTGSGTFTPDGREIPESDPPFGPFARAPKADEDIPY